MAVAGEGVMAVDMRAQLWALVGMRAGHDVMVDRCTARTRRSRRSAPAHGYRIEVRVRQFTLSNLDRDVCCLAPDPAVEFFPMRR